MQINTRDAVAGAIFIIIAALFAYGTTDLAIGTAFRMGPGYFPLVLAGVLGALGVLIVFQAVGHAPSPLTGVPWRGLILILAAPIVFGLTIRGTNLFGLPIPNLGLAPATALVVAISAFASRRATPLMAACLVVGLTLFCVLVFSYGLGLPIPRFGSAFPF